MRVPVTLSLGMPPHKPKLTDQGQWLRLKQLYDMVARVINGNVEFGNPTSGPININGVWATVVAPAAANSDFVVTHNLGRAAVAYLICTKDRACDVYTSPTANSSPSTKIILRASVASASLTLFLF